jgi:hypothetical protein
MTDHVNGPAQKAERMPEVPRLTDKDVEDLYSYLDKIDNGSSGTRSLRCKLESLFHDYRLAAFEAQGGNAAALVEEEQEAAGTRREVPAHPALATASTPISKVAREIATLHGIHDRLDAAGSERKERVFSRISVLSERMRGMEPETADDVLSLSLAVTEALGAIADRDGADDRREIEQVEETLRAVIRGLARVGAKSPLFDLYTAPDERLPWPEAAQAMLAFETEAPPAAKT